MLKVQLENVGKIVYKNIPVPEPDKDEALIDIKSVAVCFSDVLPYKGEYLNLLPLPMVQGHEFAGVIEKINGESREFKAGMKVAVYPMLSCGNCYYCKHNMDLLCENQIMFGSPKKQGAMTEKIVVPLKNLVKLNDEFDITYASLIEPTAVAYRVAGNIKNSNVVIFGAGADALLMQQICKFHDNKVITLDNCSESLKAAEDLGADLTINIGKEDSINIINNYFGADKVDEVIINKLSQNNLNIALKIIKKNGTINYMAMPVEIKIDFSDILFKAINIKGYISYSLDHFKIAANFVQKGVIDLKRMISEVFPIGKAKEAFEYISKNKEAIKVVLTK